MNKKIAVLSGDGIGPEVMNEAIRVLQKIGQKYNHKFELQEALIGGASIDQYGEPLTAEALKICEESDSILFGSVGGPKWDNLPREKRPEVGALLPLRKHFNLFANIRPSGVVKMLRDSSPLKNEIIGEGFSYTIVRELTGGIYFGEKGGDEQNEAWDKMAYSRSEIERIARVAFELARSSRGKLTNVDKANVLKTSVLWRKVVKEIHANEFSDIELDHLYIDNATMQILTRPHDFDVILTGNMFGDILSDESAQISGSIGMMASASLNDKNFGLFEPMGGSAPDIAGQGIANPIAQIRCVAMMLEVSFGLKEEAEAIENAIKKTLDDGIMTGDIWIDGAQKVGTKAITDAIIERI
jgi:3-isopropylmalate dehydrogenase